MRKYEIIKNLAKMSRVAGMKKNTSNTEWLNVWEVKTMFEVVDDPSKPREAERIGVLLTTDFCFYSDVFPSQLEHRKKTSLFHITRTH